MMAQMGAMGGMGGFPAPANWMVSYHQFLAQMQAATAAHAQQQRNAGAGGFPGMGAGMPPAGVTLPPMPGMGWGAGLGVMPGAMPGAAPAMGAMANPAAASPFRPTAVHATSARAPPKPRPPPSARRMPPSERRWSPPRDLASRPRKPRKPLRKPPAHGNRLYTFKRDAPPSRRGAVDVPCFVP